MEGSLAGWGVGTAPWQKLQGKHVEKWQVWNILEGSQPPRGGGTQAFVKLSQAPAAGLESWPYDHGGCGQWPWSWPTLMRGHLSEWKDQLGGRTHLPNRASPECHAPTSWGRPHQAEQTATCHPHSIGWRLCPLWGHLAAEGGIREAIQSQGPIAGTLG